MSTSHWRRWGHGTYEDPACQAQVYRQALCRLPMYYFAHVVHFNLDPWAFEIGTGGCKSE